nr:MAG TPA: Heat shock protein-related protein response, alpha-crystallin domain fold.4A [Bacteriophage sp.]
MSFDLQEALNGAPVKLNNGRKAFMLYDLRKYPSLLRATGRLPINGIMLGNNEDDGDHVTWDEFGKAENSYLSISGMWEEPELTSEQVLEKAYQEDLKVSLDGQDVYIIIGKAKDGSYLLGSEKSDSYVAWCVDFGKPEICLEDTAELSPKSDTITVTLPRPVRPREVSLYWRIVTKNNELCIEKMMCFIGDYRDPPACNYFASEADAKEWLDAMKNALDD